MEHPYTKQNTSFAALLEAESDRIEDAFFEKETVVGLSLAGKVFRNVTFRGCRFSETDFSECDWSDVSFDNCDLSACRMRDGFFHLVRIERSKLTGSEFSGAVFQNCSFRDCRAEYANFSDARFRGNCIFSSCDLSEAFFPSCRVSDKAGKPTLSFRDCRLRMAEFFHTKLAGFDLSSCEIEGIVLSANLEELNGATVDYSQTPVLLKKLGIRVI